MATWHDVRAIALELPATEEVVSRGLRQWKVKKKLFVWERPLRRADLEALGDAAPEGPILGAWVEHLGAKEAMLADDPSLYFTTPHFDGYAIVLARLGEIGDASRSGRSRCHCSRMRSTPSRSGTVAFYRRFPSRQLASQKFTSQVLAS